MQGWPLTVEASNGSQQEKKDVHSHFHHHGEFLSYGSIGAVGDGNHNGAIRIFLHLYSVCSNVVRESIYLCS